MRRPLLCLLGIAILGVAWAGIIANNPTNDLRPPSHGVQIVRGFTASNHTNSLHPSGANLHTGRAAPVPSRPLTAHAPILALRAIRPDGGSVDLALDGPLDLSDPLPLPDGPVAELVLTLGGPVQASDPAEGRTLALSIGELAIPLDDPDTDAEAVRLDLPPLGDGDLADALSGALLVAADP